MNNKIVFGIGGIIIGLILAIFFTSAVFPSRSGGFGMMGYYYHGKLVWSNSLRVIPEMRTIHDFIHDTLRKQFIVAGRKAMFYKRNQISYWIAGVDYRGNIVWENFWEDSTKSKYFSRIFKNTKTQGYLLVSNDLKKGRDPTELVYVDSTGEFRGRNNFEFEVGDISDYNDTMIIASVGNGSLDGAFYDFYDFQGKLLNRIKNYWFSGFIRRTKDKGLLIGNWGYYEPVTDSFIGGIGHIAKLNEDLKI